MNMNMLAVAANGMSIGEQFGKAGIVTLQGMLTVFVVLAVLWAAIEIMHRILHGKPEKKADETKKEAPKPAEPTVAPTVETAPTDDGALIAAITAAVAAAMAEEGYTGGFRVVSFKRVGNASSRRR